MRTIAVAWVVFLALLALSQADKETKNGRTHSCFRGEGLMQQKYACTPEEWRAQQKESKQ